MESKSKGILRPLHCSNLVIVIINFHSNAAPKHHANSLQVLHESLGRTFHLNDVSFCCIWIITKLLKLSNMEMMGSSLASRMMALKHSHMLLSNIITLQDA
ncbi:hypothetical protein KFK09_021040 [Dendrobium nobile]|uniref:Uncharacterized protein n=1 Tax=Dendrobium nobile TaxID=94219 RepID=A0A8T3ANB4_DENNO|nr:hypothetical protein KFK09_021040 [Dendrobium nobile]